MATSIKPLLYMLSGAGLVLVLIGGVSLVSGQKSIQGFIKGETSTPIPSPTASPTITPTATLTPTITLTPTPRIIYIKPTTLPTPTTPKLTEVRIGVKTYQCQEDKANEVREAYIKYVEAEQKLRNCLFTCLSNTTTCVFSCANLPQADFSNCKSGCTNPTCDEICNNSKTQKQTYLDIVNNLIDRYCKQ